MLVPSIVEFLAAKRSLMNPYFVLPRKEQETAVFVGGQTHLSQVMLTCVGSDEGFNIWAIPFRCYISAPMPVDVIYLLSSGSVCLVTLVGDRYVEKHLSPREPVGVSAGIWHTLIYSHPSNVFVTTSPWKDQVPIWEPDKDELLQNLPLATA
jgi:hypothetical protein